MKFLDKLNQVIDRAKVTLTSFVKTDGNSIGKNIKYSEDTILNAGITRDYKSKLEEREVTAIRAERKKQYRVTQRITKNKNNQ